MVSQHVQKYTKISKISNISTMADKLFTQKNSSIRLDFSIEVGLEYSQKEKLFIYLDYFYSF